MSIVGLFARRIGRITELSHGITEDAGMFSWETR